MFLDKNHNKIRLFFYKKCVDIFLGQFIIVNIKLTILFLHDIFYYRARCFCMREKVILICTQCLSRNYTTTKQKTNSQTRLTIKKYCPKCNASTIHKESK